VKIISRQEAIAKGLKRYFTGVPCIHGHTCERYTKHGNECVECGRLSQQRRRVRDPERVRLQWREWAARQGRDELNRRKREQKAKREKINRHEAEMETA
jgi:hypothetical protein